MLLVRGARPLAGAATRLSPRGLSTTNKFVLTLNAGSSSIKFGVFDVAGGTPVERCSGIVEEVGSDHSRLKLVVDGEVKRDVADLHIKGHGEALANIRDALAPQLPGEIAAVGHRHQACACLLNSESAWLYDARTWCRRMGCGSISFDNSRIF